MPHDPVLTCHTLRVPSARCRALTSGSRSQTSPAQHSMDKKRIILDNVDSLRGARTAVETPSIASGLERGGDRDKSVRGACGREGKGKGRHQSLSCEGGSKGYVFRQAEMAVLSGRQQRLSCKGGSNGYTVRRRYVRLSWHRAQRQAAAAATAMGAAATDGCPTAKKLLRLPQPSPGLTPPHTHKP